MEAEDVDEDRSENKQTDVSGFGNGDKKPPDHFQDLDEGEISRGVKRPHEERRWRAFLRGGNGNELQKEIQTEDDEKQTKKATCDDWSVFHIFYVRLVLLKESDWGKVDVCLD